MAALLVALLGLSACGTTLHEQSGAADKPATAAAAPAPVVASTPAPAMTSYVVQRGDTLSALSRRTGASVAQLASMNELPPPYLLKIGQTLRLPDVAAPAASPPPMMAGLPALPGAAAPAPQAAPRAAVAQAALPALEPAAPRAGSSLPQARPPQAVPPKAAVTPKATAEPYVVPSLTSAVAKPEMSTAAPPALPAASRSPASAETRAAAAEPAAAPAPPARSGAGFLMPVAGKVIAEFGPQNGGLHNDGINIAAAKGTPVKAAENGVVVYAGNEVRGFGNLLLVQHEGGFTTAYAHLDSMVVQRGHRVGRGQKIGTVGMTGNVTAPQLHFEIRQGKQPIDPEKQMAQSRPHTAMIGQLR